MESYWRIFENRYSGVRLLLLRCFGSSSYACEATSSPSTLQSLHRHPAIIYTHQPCFGSSRNTRCSRTRNSDRIVALVRDYLALQRIRHPRHPEEKSTISTHSGMISYDPDKGFDYMRSWGTGCTNFFRLDLRFHRKPLLFKTELEKSAPLGFYHSSRCLSLICMGARRGYWIVVRQA